MGIKSVLRGIRGFLNWFYFLFIWWPFFTLRGVFVFIFLIVPFLPIYYAVVFIGSAFGDNYSGLLAPLCTVICAFMFYSQSEKGKKMISWVIDLFHLEIK